MSNQPEHEDDALVHEGGAFDPYSLSKRDWDIIAGVLRDRAEFLRRKSERYGVGEEIRKSLEEAADRRMALAVSVVRMKMMFAKQLDSSQAPEL